VPAPAFIRVTLALRVLFLCGCEVKQERIVPPIGIDDAEMSYRRGFEHGATEILRAVAGLLEPGVCDALQAWISDVHQWRYKAMLNYPPTWRLERLSNE
jgi:hypothetical protein